MMVLPRLLEIEEENLRFSTYSINIICSSGLPFGVRVGDEVMESSVPRSGGSSVCGALQDSGSGIYRDIQYILQTLFLFVRSL